MKKTKKIGKKNNILNYIWKKTNMDQNNENIYSFFTRIFFSFILKFEKLEKKIFPYEEKNHNK